MSDLRTAAQQALEALESVLCNPDGKCCIDGSNADRAVIDAALTALRAVLAQQEEPQTTHSSECWRWHHKCAVAKIERECKHD